MVSVPGKEISTPPFDQHLAQLIASMSAAGAKNYQSITTLTTVENQPTLRTVFPSVASRAACVSCHNEIQQDRVRWNQGDLMGAYVIDQGLTRLLAGINYYATLVGLLTGSLLFLALVVLRQYSKLRQQSQNLRLLAEQDSLTGCLNRRALLRKTADIHGRCGAEGGLLIMDLDHFKQINDARGHEK